MSALMAARLKREQEMANRPLPVPVGNTNPFGARTGPFGPKG